MRKKFTLVLGLLVMVLASNAQTLLKEDFEACTIMPPSGWTVIDDTQAGTVNHWELYKDDKGAIAGTRSAFCNSGSFLYSEPIKEEWLITPALTLDDNSYKLEYKWVGASASAFKNEYDFKIRISEDNGQSWTEAWSFLNKEQVEKSGVLFPWTGWAKNTSVVNLSAWKGKTIKIAFVHCKLMTGLGKGNSIKIDDILVEKYTPIENPVAEGSSSYIFNNAYMGVKKYSEPLSIRNVGVDTLEVLAIEGLEGTDFSTNLVPGKVKLTQKQEYQYNAIYTPTLTGGRSATMTIKTNGGDVQVALQGTKLVLPANYTLESFEGDVYPPLGWTSGSDWKRYNAGFSGDYCVYSSLSSNGEMITPRLDLSAAGTYSLTFDMLEDYTPASDDAVGPENELELYFTSDGGKNWSKLNFQNLKLNEMVRVKVDLGSPASDNCYVKFRYAMELDLSGGYDELPEYSTIFVDDVVLPPLYGRNAAPVAATNPVPANNAVNVYNEDVKLAWSGSQFATGYKLYVGTSDGNFDIVNGTVVTATSYQIPSLLNNSTKYFWKVVPFNNAGECADAKVWQFTTMADQSIKTFPYFEGFEGDVFPTLGWQNIKITSYGGWSRTNISSYDGKYSAMVSSNQNNSQDILQTPAIQLPADKEMQISFYWGNSVPTGLTKPKAPAVSTVVDNDTLYFEIKTNGKWNVLARLSAIEKEGQTWVRERIMLSDYKGQTVAFRWRYNVISGMKASGGALDNVMIDEAAMGGKAVINAQGWNSGSVNYKKSYSSGEVFSLLNDGEQSMTLKKISFKSKNFVSSLSSNTVLSSRGSVRFSVTFNAGDANALVQDTMVLEFENAAAIRFPVEGTALSSTVRYYSFDEDQFGSMNPQGFTMIDVDGAATCRPVFINYPNYGNAYAFIVMNQKPEPEGADWRNIYPRSGDQMLAAMSPQLETLSSNDWIISEKMLARDHAQFRFYAKSYGSADSFENSRASVWVSTTDNKKNSFVPVQNAQSMVIPHIDNHSNQNFTEYVVDLSAWKGQPIYVALQHTVSAKGFVAFFDDFFYEDFDFGAEENSAPIFMSTPKDKTKIGELYTYDLQVYDADSDPITITNTGLPSWLTFTPNEKGGIYTGTPSTMGEVMFRIKASDGKVSVNQDVIIDVTDGSGVEDVNVASVKVYPNPVKNMLHVDGTDVETIQVYDLTGNLILSNSGMNEVSVESLVAGTYIVRIQSAGRVYSTRVVKM